LYYAYDLVSTKCIVRPYGTAGCMIPCIHVLFQPIFAAICFKFSYHGTI